jgi:hypothetical protein
MMPITQEVKLVSRYYTRVEHGTFSLMYKVLHFHHLNSFMISFLLEKYIQSRR